MPSTWTTDGSGLNPGTIGLRYFAISAMTSKDEEKVKLNSRHSTLLIVGVVFHKHKRQARDVVHLLSCREQPFKPSGRPKGSNATAYVCIWLKRHVLPCHSTDVPPLIEKERGAGGPHISDVRPAGVRDLHISRGLRVGLIQSLDCLMHERGRGRLHPLCIILP